MANEKRVVAQVRGPKRMGPMTMLFGSPLF